MKNKYNQVEVENILYCYHNETNKTWKNLDRERARERESTRDRIQYYIKNVLLD